MRHAILNPNGGKIVIGFLMLSILFASLNSVLLHKVRLRGKGAIYHFNFICAAIWCVLLFAANGFRLTVNSTVLLWGCIYGITQALFIFFKTAAMNSGPVSVTTLIGNCSLAVSVLVCLLVWNEAVSSWDLLGLLLLLAGVFFATYQKGGEPPEKRWPILVVLFFLCAAGVGISFKAFSKSGSADCAGDMMLIAALTMLVAYSLLCMTVRDDSNASPNKNHSLAFWGFALARAS